MRKTLLIVLGIGVSTNVCCAFYNPSDPYYVRMHKATFAGRKPREIARFLAHPDTLTQKGAVAALADTPDAALPLVEKLLTDENAWIRAGAVDVLAQITARRARAQASGDDARRGAQTEAIRLLYEHLPDETSAQVLHSVCQLFMASTFDPETMIPFVARSALSEHPDTRKAAMQTFSRPQLHEAYLIQMAIAVMAESDDNINEETHWATIAIHRARNHPAAREALSVVAEHLHNRVTASAPAFRKRGWHQMVDRELSLFEAQWKTDTELVQGVVPAICRAVVRLPRGRTRSGDLQARAKRLLDRCRSSSALTIRACARQEAEWLSRIADDNLLSVMNGYTAEQMDAEESRNACRSAVEYLESVADRLGRRGRIENDPGPKDDGLER